MGQKAEIEWRGNVPVSTRFADPYFSFEDGLAETRHVFLGGNDLPQRFGDGFHIAELGFGTGLNLLAALDLWRNSQQDGLLRYTTFEAYPLKREDMIAAQAAFPELAPLADALADFWCDAPAASGGDARPLRIMLPDLAFEMIRGDARATLPRWNSRADAWFLDGFAPARNPELWEPGLLDDVARHTAPGGTAATYTAAGAVRRGLTEAGFAVERRAGFGRKRHMTVARMPRDE